MKSLVNYVLENIYEDVEQYRLNSVVATYDVEPTELILQAPESFNESDVQQYINDMWLQQMPSNSDYSEKLFGNNNDNIVDVYFKYDTYEHLNVEPKEYIEFDSKYSKNTKQDEKLDYFKLKNVKYIIEFDRFDLADADDDNVKELLEKIFESAESNNYNKWAIEIKFNKDALEYRK